MKTLPAATLCWPNTRVSVSWVIVLQWSFFHPNPAFPCGMSLSALIVTTFHTALSSRGRVQRCYYMRLFLAAKVVLSVTKLCLSDHPPPKPRARGRDILDEIVWVSDHKIQNVLQLMVSDISVHSTSENVCPFLESRRAILWGHSPQMYILYLYSLSRFDRVPRDYFIFQKLKEEGVLVSR